jgi:hypothetical protein
MGKQWILSARLVRARFGAVALFTAFGCGEDEAGCRDVTCAAERSDSVANAGAGGSRPRTGLVGTSSGGTPGLVDTEVCQGQSLEAQAAPVNALILFDRSASMLDPADSSNPASPTRWDAMTAAVREFVANERVAGAQLGLQFFGLSNAQDDCSVEKYRTPSVPMGPLEQVREPILAALARTQPGSLTPTQPALEGALAYARTVAALPENAERATVVVLVSDGQPSECPFGPNGQPLVSIGDIEDVIESYASPPAGQVAVRTYVVGTEELSANVERFARAGDAEAFLLGGSDVQGALLQSMLNIVTKPLTCEVPVPAESTNRGETIDLERIRVRFTAAVGGAVREFPRARGAGDCFLGDGWYYDDPSQPTKIVFCTETCGKLGAGRLQVEFGCQPETIVR